MLALVMVMVQLLVFFIFMVLINTRSGIYILVWC